MSTQRYTAQEVADALIKAKGFVSVAARRIGCTPATIRNYIGRYETCKQAIYDAKEEMKDFAEGKLYQNIDDNKEASLIFYLKTQAKDRGYVERQEVTGPNEGPIQFEDVTKLSDEELERIVARSSNRAAE